jgi:allophanate hydrolase subunit 2
VIACVIAADLARLAQLRAGDGVRFATIEVDAARALAAEAWEIRELG